MSLSIFLCITKFNISISFCSFTCFFFQIRMVALCFWVPGKFCSSTSYAICAHMVALILLIHKFTETHDCVFYSLMQFRWFSFLSYQKIGFNALGQHELKVEEKCYFELIFCFHINRSWWWGYWWNSCWNSGCSSVSGSCYIFWILPEEEDTKGGTFFARFHCTLFSRWERYGYF